MGYLSTFRDLLHWKKHIIKIYKPFDTCFPEKKKKSTSFNLFSGGSMHSVLLLLNVPCGEREMSLFVTFQGKISGNKDLFLLNVAML